MANNMNFLKPCDKPKAEFVIKAENVGVRRYWNIHGFLKS
jgi:hypothetical protein